MEDPIFDNSSTDIQNENVNPSVHKEDISNSTAVFPVKEISYGTNGNLEIVIENKAEGDLNGYNDISCKSPTSCDSLQMSELVNKKTSSPTLIESAIKVVKNLFSPEKVKGNTSSATSPCNSKSSPGVSTGISNKTETFALEPDNEIHSNIQITPGENSFKTNSHNSESDTLQTPIILEPLNNTDESFMTTVSLIEDSFHSAVTNLDEQGDFTLGPFLKDNFLNSSLISDFISPTNDTLENNNSCLESTMLKIDNVSSDGIQCEGSSVQNKDQSIKNLSNTQTNGRNSYLDDSEKVSSTQVQYDKCSIQSQKGLKSEVLGISTEINSDKGAALDVGNQEKFEKTPQLLETADINSNKSVVKQVSSEPREMFSNGFDKLIEIERNFNLEAEADKSNENYLRRCYNEDSCVNSSISTTTIVLETGQSVDLENRLLSLKTDYSDTNISTSTFEDYNNDCWLKKEISQHNLLDESLGYPIQGNISQKNQRSCFSEGNSPNTSGFILTKLNKSDESLNRKLICKSFKGNLKSDEPLLNFSLEKSSETSKLSDNVIFRKNFNQTKDSENNKSKVGSTLNEKNLVPVISQQSYTVLNVQDKSLNRPVIEPLKNSNDLSKQAFQKNDSEETLSTDFGIIEKCGNNSANSSFDAEDLDRSPKVKQSTPLCEGNKETNIKVFRPTTLRLKSPEVSKSVCGDTKFIKNYEQNNLLSVKGERIFTNNKSIDGCSPVHPDSDSDVGSKKNQMITTFKDQNNVNQSPGLKKLKKSSENCGETVAQNLNQTYYKKQSPLKIKNYEKSETRVRLPPNQTFEEELKSPVMNSSTPHKSPKHENLNSTFNLNTSLTRSNKTFTEETNSKEINEANLTFDKVHSPESCVLNKTYDKPLNNESNSTFTKNTESPTPHKLNETFDKKSESSVLGAQVLGRILESGDESDQTFVMDREKSVEGSNNQSVSIKESEMFESGLKVGLNSISSREKSDSQKLDKLNSTFNLNTRSTCSNKTFTDETNSKEINEANLTFDKVPSPESCVLNKTYDKPLNSANSTFTKNTESPTPQKLNETFDKKSESSVLGIQVSGKVLESGNATNQTFFVDGEPNLANNKMEGEILESVSKVDNTFSKENKTVTEVFKNPVSSEYQLHSNSSFPALSLLDYRNYNNPERVVLNDDSSISIKSSNTSFFCSDVSTVVSNEEDGLENRSIDELSEKLGKMYLNDNNKQLNLTENISFLKETMKEQTLEAEDNLLSSLKDDKLRCDADLVQLIREQFSSNDIEKICNVVQELYPAKLTNDILKASEQFDKSFHGNASDLEFKLPEVPLSKEKTVNALSPQSFDFLNSIGGKPTGRDLSRESLYVKFDPLVQPSASSLIDFTKEGEPLSGTESSPVKAHSSSICEQLLAISPQKKPDAIVPPLTPLSHKVKADSDEDKLERLKALQNEIYFLKNLYSERERSNKTKMEEYENQIAKLTGESCMLEDKLKDSNEREKSLVKKMKEQTQSIGQLKIIMEEYVKVISKLSSELEVIKSENLKQLETLSLEKDSYMTHLQNTEAAFTDVHAKYEKSKKTIVSMKANETSYKNTIAEQAQKIEEFKLKAKEAQEKALLEFQKIQEELNQTKANHSQEAARLKAQLRKTELKVEALQESLDQKIKENQQLTAICDELIEGKK